MADKYLLHFDYHVESSETIDYHTIPDFIILIIIILLEFFLI